MVIESFSSKIVFLDSAPLIYFIEGNSRYRHVLFKLFNSNDKRNFSLITSSITILKVMVKPLSEGKVDIVDQYKNILMKSPGIEVLDVTSSIAEAAAQLRVQYNLKTLDAIQLATCIEKGANFFLTTDIRLKAVNKVNVVTLNELI